MPELTKQQRIKRDLEYKVQEYYRGEDEVMLVKVITVHPGPTAWKTVSLLTFGNVVTGEVRGHELRAQTWAARPIEEGGGYDFTKNDYHWHCEGDEEVEAVRLFLNAEFPGAGKYLLIERGSELVTLLDHVQQGTLKTADVVRLIQIAGSEPDLVSALAASPGGFLLAEAVQLQRRRNQLAELQRIINDPNSNERDDIHPQLKKMTWVFGGRYVGESKRKQLTTGDVLDIPLLRPDGSLHVVELKGANIPHLVERHRGTWDRQTVAGELEAVPLILGSDVHRAVGQAMNYLCHLDETRDHILSRFKIDTRRASATVLIGQPSFVQGFSREEIDETLRIYNSHLARIEVLHYADLIESAGRALAVGEEPDPEDDSDQVSRAIPVNSDFDDPWSPPDPTYWPDEPPF